MFDKNGDDELSVEEIKGMLEPIKSVDEKMIKRAINEIDRKGKTSVTLNEFKIMMQKLFE